MEHFTVNGVKYITDKAFVRLNITDHPDVKDRLPRLFTLDDAAVNMMWKDAPPFCRYCKKANHSILNCRNLEKRKQRSQQGNPEPEIRTKEISEISGRKANSTAPILSKVRHPQASVL
ncbi:uncharacterized protein VTP21DRAFT_7871 [Calcarisporiella thermophila]|uniref:uncharacterized protein n=1 Tax=Calcarisporiella thermophila TaxID=911321 RepID=UPI00374288E0